MTKLLAVLALSAFGCAAAPPSAPAVPTGAKTIGASSSCRCVLVHLTTTACPTRAVDLAAIKAKQDADASLCAYELLVDDPDVERSELRDFVEAARGAPVDLVTRPGRAPLRVTSIDDACGS